ncbi:hypothetical protein LR48_Vigan04g251700 [Vigna angularis]|uniref:DYW domain-containing protein n=1 Tax=Phaseolus angularis TaxID=3914 RepID=A0A0L9UID2_PHAAN|nr:hypothetical protein LR48_Vigan04g251700 [Vigna angularis]
MLMSKKGLVKSTRSSIRIVMNLSSYEEFIKLISYLYQADIIGRDTIRIRHFKNGEYSCKYY